jgi:hypothetical protein
MRRRLVDCPSPDSPHSRGRISRHPGTKTLTRRARILRQPAFSNFLLVRSFQTQCSGTPASSGGGCLSNPLALGIPAHSPGINDRSTVVLGVDQIHDLRSAARLFAEPQDRALAQVNDFQSVGQTIGKANAWIGPRVCPGRGAHDDANFGAQSHLGAKRQRAASFSHCTCRSESSISGESENQVFSSDRLTP